MSKSEIKKYSSLKAVLLESTKTVTIKISDDELKNLKGNDYMLCFAKKVGDNLYNVVWQAYDKYLSENVFSWTPQYQLFGTNNFTSGAKVSTRTNIVTIGLGQSSTLDQYGLLNAPVSGGPGTSVTLNNSYGNIYPGVNQICTGIDGSIISAPTYVAEKASIKGNIVSYTPTEKVAVWFQQDIETSTMINNINGNPVEIDLNLADSATRLYSNGKWRT